MHLQFLCSGGNENAFQTVPTISNKTKAASDSKERILSGAISKCGSFLALSDDQKQLSLWEWNNGWTLKSQRNLERRATCTVFSREAKVVLIADKSGDVYEFSVRDDGPGRLLLGHLSMLLGVALSRDEKYIITCDRDEKIRVSHYPNAYSIHNYCLGHKDFVTRLCLLDGAEDILVSSSGDGTIRLWRTLDGSQLSSRHCLQDVGGTSTKENEMAAVKKIATFTFQDGELFIVAAVEGFSALLCYSVDKANWTLALHQRLDLRGDVWDVDLDCAGDLWAVLRVPEEDSQAPLIRYCRKDSLYVQDENFVCEAALAKEINGWRDFPQSLSELSKGWHDNVSEYMERKEERLRSGKKLKQETNGAKSAATP